MEKKMNKIEEIEINEEVKVEELTEETLDEVDGGIAATTMLTIKIVAWGAPYAWKAGQWIGKQIVGH